MKRSWRGVVFCATSVDGFIARPDGAIGWLDDPVPTDHPGVVTGEDATGSFDSLMTRVDHMVMGRHTLDKLLTFDEWPYPIPVMVLSTILARDADARVSVVRSVDEAVQSLNAAGALSVYVDGGQTVQAFLRAGLIDEITVTRAPVLIGTGIPLFGDLPADVRLSLQQVEASDGYLHARYDVIH